MDVKEKWQKHKQQGEVFESDIISEGDVLITCTSYVDFLLQLNRHIDADSILYEC